MSAHSRHVVRLVLGSLTLGALLATATQATFAQSLPTAANDAYTIPESSGFAVGAPGVLANDTNASSAGLLTGPAHGSLSFNSDGSFNYTPASGFLGTDSFQYRAFDAQLDVSAPATVTITVVPAPVAANDAYSTLQDTPLTVAAPGVLANDTNALSVTLVSGPAHGTLSLNSDGSFTYTPAPGFSGSDSFTYSAVGAQNSKSTVATVAITVAPTGTSGGDTGGGGPNPGATPELDSLVLFGSGLAGAASYWWRRRRAARRLG